MLLQACCWVLTVTPSIPAAADATIRSCLRHAQIANGTRSTAHLLLNPPTQYCTTKCTEDLGGRDMFGVAEEWTSCLLRRRMAPAERQHLQQINKQLQQRDPAGIQRFVDLFDPNE